MSASRWTPDEVARVIALPQDHPDRRRAMSDAEFAALALALPEFEAPRVSDVAARELESVRAEILRRVVDARPARPAPSSPNPRTRSARAASAPGRDVLAGMLRGMRGPVGALAFASVVVALAVWWNAGRSPRAGVDRAIVPPGAFVLAPPRPGDGRLTLAWTHASGADGYRVVFLGASLDEIARLDGVADTTLTLTAAGLPAGLSTGDRVSVEVVALREGTTIATTVARSIRVP